MCIILKKGVKAQPKESKAGQNPRRTICLSYNQQQSNRIMIPAVSAGINTTSHKEPPK